MKAYLLGCLCLLFFACTSRPVEPTRASRHAIDTLFHQQIMVLEPEVDSLCNLMAKEVFDKAVDSIMHAREMEMHILIE
jgi:hypothetical protein